MEDVVKTSVSGLIGKIKEICKEILSVFSKIYHYFNDKQNNEKLALIILIIFIIILVMSIIKYYIINNQSSKKKTPIWIVCVTSIFFIVFFCAFFLSLGGGGDSVVGGLPISGDKLTIILIIFLSLLVIGVIVYNNYSQPSKYKIKTKNLFQPITNTFKFFTKFVLIFLAISVGVTVILNLPGMLSGFMEVFNKANID